MERLLLERSNSNIIGTKRYWSAPIQTFFVIIGSMLQSYHEPFWTGVNFLWLLERCSNHTKYTYWLDLKNIGSNRTQINSFIYLLNPSPIHGSMQTVLKLLFCWQLYLWISPSSFDFVLALHGKQDLLSDKTVDL